MTFYERITAATCYLLGESSKVVMFVTCGVTHVKLDEAVLELADNLVK